MNLFEKISHIYIQVEPCDLRKGIDGYAALVNSEFNLDPMDSNSLYIFCNRNHNKLKCLYYDVHSPEKRNGSSGLTARRSASVERCEMAVTRD